MRKPRIYHDAPLESGRTVTLGEAAGGHVARVLRLAPGAHLVLFNGDGLDREATVLAVRRDGVEVRVGAAHAVAAESPVAVTLLQGICRGQRMDTVIQKATELGVTTIQPVAAARSVVRLDGARAERRVAHWRGVAIGACEQCGRARVPTIAAPLPLDAALDTVAQQSGVTLDPAGQPPATVLAASPPAIALLVGPEGGLDDAERALAAARGFTGMRLGPRILRTETAPLVALALVQYLAGDLGPR